VTIPVTNPARRLCRSASGRGSAASSALAHTKGIPDFGPMLNDAARRAVAKRSPEARSASAKKASMRQREK
jgi:hypothetical protein